MNGSVAAVARSGRLDILPGAPVFGPDGLIGQIQQILLGSGGQVDGIVVGTSQGREIVLPLAAIDWANEDEAHAHLTTVEVDRLADRGAWSGYRQGSRLDVGQTLACGRQRVGPLELVLIDPAAGRVVGLVVHLGGMLGRDVLVPFAWVDEITHDRIVLAVPRARLDRAPEYQSNDQTLTATFRAEEGIVSELASAS